jgi:hypothetical protein
METSKVKKEFEQHQMGACIQDKIRLFPESYQTVLILYDLMDFSHQEIAEIVDISVANVKISDHQQNWGYEEGPWKGPGPPSLVAADLIHKPPASIRFAPIKHTLAVTVEPFKFSPASPVAYELS